jgi:hypothetical protein
MLTGLALVALVAYLYKRWEVVPEDVRWMHGMIDPTVAVLVSLGDVIKARACPRPTFPRPKSLQTFLQTRD